MKSIGRLFCIALIIFVAGCAGRTTSSDATDGIPVQSTPLPQSSPTDEAAPVPVSPPPAAAPTIARGTDLLAALRGVRPSDSPDAYWAELDEALQRLQTLEGAHFDPDTGRLTLLGTTADESGPLRLEDLVTAFRAEFQQLESLGVTIDPIPEDPTGPWMVVKFFGGAENTRFGQVMFESDRLLKNLGLGKHNETLEPVTSQVEGFYSLPQLNLAVDSAGAAVWSRFWISPSLEQFADDDSRGKPIVSVSGDGNSIWFEHTPMFVLTEVMTEPENGGRLVSSGGKQDKASAYFANLITAKYDAFAKEYPVLGELQELSKLLILADWIRQRGFPINFEMLYLNVETPGVETPERTPTLSVESSVQSENQIRTIKLLGGVTMRSRPFYAQDSEGSAKNVGDVIAAQPPEALNRVSHTVPAASGPAKRIVNHQQYPQPPPTPTRQKLPERESTGQVRLSTLPGKPALKPPSPRSPEPISSAVLEGYTLPIFQDPGTRKQILNFPVSRVGYNPKHTRTAIVEVAGKRYEERFPDYLHIVSPLGDIDIRFENKPEFDLQRRAFFFAARSPHTARYFKASNTLELDNGDRFRFDPKTGVLTGISGKDKPQLDISYEAYSDGPFVEREQLILPLRARPPPEPVRQSLVLRESSGVTTSTEMSMSVWNPSRAQSLGIREQNGRLIQSESDLNKRRS